VLVATADEQRSADLRRCLAGGGLSNPVRHAASAEDVRALEHEPALRPVVVVLDLELPERAALGLLAELAHPQGPWRVPVVVLGDEATDAEVAEAYRLGAQAYLSPGLAPHVLVDVIRSLRMPWALTRGA